MCVLEGVPSSSHNSPTVLYGLLVTCFACIGRCPFSLLSSPPSGIQSCGTPIYCAHLISRIYPVVNAILAVSATAHAVSTPPYERPECHCTRITLLVSTYTYDSVLVNPPLLCSPSLVCETTCPPCMVWLCSSMCMCCRYIIVFVNVHAVRTSPRGVHLSGGPCMVGCVRILSRCDRDKHGQSRFFVL